MSKKRDGLEYFPFDVVMEDSYALIEAEFGLVGFAITVKLFQKIYGERGYYCEWQEENVMLFAHKIGMKHEEVKAVVAAALKRGIFDLKMYNKYHILTSKSIQEIYFEAASRRKENYADSRFLLLSEEELPKNVYINGKNVNTNGKRVDINAKNVDTSAQRKGKESKGKQSKGKQSKGKDSKADASCSVNPEDAQRLFKSICPGLESNLTDAARSDIISAQQHGVDLKELFSRVQRSDFLSGRSNKWRCSLEWAVKAKNADKIMRGQYDLPEQNACSPPCDNRRKTSYSLAELEAIDEFR